MKVKVRKWLKKVIQRYREDEWLKSIMAGMVSVLIVVLFEKYVIQPVMCEQI